MTEVTGAPPEHLCLFLVPFFNDGLPGKRKPLTHWKLRALKSWRPHGDSNPGSFNLRHCWTSLSISAINPRGGLVAACPRFGVRVACFKLDECAPRSPCR